MRSALVCMREGRGTDITKWSVPGPSQQLLRHTYPDATNIEAGAHSVWQQPDPHRRQEGRRGYLWIMPFGLLISQLGNACCSLVTPAEMTWIWTRPTDLRLVNTLSCSSLPKEWGPFQRLLADLIADRLVAANHLL